MLKCLYKISQVSAKQQIDLLTAQAWFSEDKQLEGKVHCIPISYFTMFIFSSFCGSIECRKSLWNEKKIKSVFLGSKRDLYQRSILSRNQLFSQNLVSYWFLVQCSWNLFEKFFAMSKWTIWRIVDLAAWYSLLAALTGSLLPHIIPV